jgi:hypothetical protein
MLTMRKLLMMTAACLAVAFAPTAQAQLPKNVQIIDKLPPKATGIFTNAAAAKIGMAWEYKNGKFIAIHGQVPPEQFDHQYTGVIQIFNFPTKEEFTGKCPSAFDIACSATKAMPSGKPQCVISMGPEDEIMNKGLRYIDVLQHEIAHCNGWSSDHVGGRIYYIHK